MVERGMNIILGVDSGATKIEVAVVNSEGVLLGLLRENIPGNPASIGFNKFISNLTGILRRTLERFPKTRVTGVGIGLAGYLEGLWNEGIKREVWRVLEHSAEVEIAEDIYTAHVAAHLFNDGIVGILGTGSNFYGICRGRSWRVGGWGHLINDRGGAYSIGARALSMVVKSLDGRIDHTVLVDYAFQHYGVSSVHELVSKIYSSEDPKNLIASFTPYVFKAYLGGDNVAVEIVNTEVKEVALAIVTILRKLQCYEIPISLTGSVFRENKDILKKLLEEELSRELGKSINIGEQVIRESCASALLVLRKSGKPLTSIVENIIRTCP